MWRSDHIQPRLYRLGSLIHLILNDGTTRYRLYLCDVIDRLYWNVHSRFSLQHYYGWSFYEFCRKMKFADCFNQVERQFNNVTVEDIYQQNFNRKILLLQSLVYCFVEIKVLEKSPLIDKWISAYNDVVSELKNFHVLYYFLVKLFSWKNHLNSQV